MAKIDDANFNPGTGESSYKPNTSDSNITPPRGAYASQGQFRFWCQKVLPLVYDDSLSYYELLCKVVDYLNKTMQNVAVLEQDVTDTNKAFSDLQEHMNEQVTEVDNQFANLQDYTNEQIENVRTAFNELQQYVNDYYHSLDVQEEINNKLDQMAEDGTLDTIIKPYFDTYKSEIDEVMKQQNQSLDLQNQKINNQDARISAIVAQAGNDNTEVVDARVGATNLGSKTYDSLGDAIREQITNIDNMATSMGNYVAHIRKTNTPVPFLASPDDVVLFIATDEPFDIDSAPLITGKLNVYFLDETQKRITYYSTYDGSSKYIYNTLQAQYMTKEGFYVEIDSPALQENEVTVLNITKLFKAGLLQHCNNSCIPVYAQGEVTYKIKPNSRSIVVTIPVVGRSESNPGQSGYFPTIVNDQQYQSWRLAENTDYIIFRDDGKADVTLNSGEYLAIFYKPEKIPWQATRTTVPINCIPLFGNIAGNFLNYTGNIPVYIAPEPDPDTIIVEENNSNVLTTINRFGSGFGQPEVGSSIRKALRNGFNGVRVDLQFTSDGVPVCWHDPYINQYYKNVYTDEGELVPYSDDNRISIAESTLEGLNKYHWGGANYPAGVPQLNYALISFRYTGGICVLEQKAPMSSLNARTVATLIYQNGMGKNTYIACSSFDDINTLAPLVPDATFGIMPETITEEQLTTYESLAKTYNMFWWAWDTTEVTVDIAKRLSIAGIKFWAGDFNTLDKIKEFLDKRSNKYCSGVETSVATAGTMLKYN